MPIALEIVSPEKLLLSRSVDMVTIPAAEGEMGVLEGHTPMIVTLAGGTIGLYDGDNLVEQLFVVGGFAEVTPAGCTVLADEALPLEQVTDDSLAQRERGFACKPVANDDELLAAETEDVVGGAHCRHDVARNALQHLIARGVPEPVVERLEMVDVEGEDGRHMAATNRTRELTRDHLVEAAGLPAPVGEPHVMFSDGVHVRIGLPHAVR